jgi:hypothetical protein
MFVRCLALLFIPILPFVPLMADFGPAATASDVIAGSLASALALFSLVNRRARVAVALVGGWVAFSPFVLRMSFFEEVVAVAWGVSTFALMVGPFSDTPRVIIEAAAAPVTPQRESARERHLPIAA